MPEFGMVQHFLNQQKQHKQCLESYITNKDN